jgi:hypothetical protein
VFVDECNFAVVFEAQEQLSSLGTVRVESSRAEPWSIAAM